MIAHQDMITLFCIVTRTPRSLKEERSIRIQKNGDREWPIFEQKKIKRSLLDLKTEDDYKILQESINLHRSGLANKVDMNQGFRNLF